MTRTRKGRKRGLSETAQEPSALASQGKHGPSVSALRISAVRSFAVLEPASRRLTEGDVYVAMQKLWDFMEKEMSEELKNKVGLSTILLEHALCKYSRLKLSASQPI